MPWRELRSAVWTRLPKRQKDAYQRASYAHQVIRSLGGIVPRHCNICGNHGRFKATGMPPRPDAMCPECQSLDRHRLLKLLIDQRISLLDSRDVLHFAPEPSVSRFAMPMARSYTTADREVGRADLAIDIEAMTSVADATFDLILCSHVLEHVNDQLALAEIFRILRPGGVALLMVPVIEGWATTYENPGVRTPEERVSHFGQFDHARFYGADVRDRIKGAGFELDEFTAVEPFVLKHGLLRGEKVFIASRPTDTRGKISRRGKASV